MRQIKGCQFYYFDTNYGEVIPVCFVFGKYKAHVLQVKDADYT